MRSSALIFLLLLANSPAFAASCNIAAISPGMTQAQVTSKCGAPSVVENNFGAITKWIYAAGANNKAPFDIIWFNAGKNTVRNALHFVK